MTESSMPELASLEHRASVRSQVLQALRGALVAGQLQPGQVYSAPVLARQFGVSATPVREAMLELAKEALVIAVPNKGFRVRELSDRELDEITEIRQLLEVPATVGIIGVATPAELLALRSTADLIVETARNKDLVSYVEHDRDFHLTMLALGGNAQLVQLVGELRSRSRLYGLAHLAERGELIASAEEHLEILRLVEARDAGRLEQLMRRHIGHVRGSWAGRPEPTQ
jgi:DNA-binding GntR family transcriptional regulator